MRELVVLQASGSPQAIGAAHGSAFADEIKEYLADRTALSRQGTDLTTAEVTDIAARMLPAHEEYDRDSFAEMVSMAEAAGISPAQAIIVGGYTDFIDTVRSVASGTAIEDTCTAVITPGYQSDGRGFLAQTWDMHASATSHVFLLDATPDNAPRSLIFTTHGTLGQIGMNDAGIAIGINNLTMDDGTYGVTWPFVVRKALRQTTFDAALACITDADLAGGHSFLLLDARGEGANVEATSTRTAVERLDTEALVHTNHCLFSATREVEADRPAELEESTTRRLLDARSILASTLPHTALSLMSMLKDENSICRHPSPPFNYESSGAVVMRPGSLDMWACWGIPSENEFEQFTLA